jgi:hypothetical protein
MLPVRCWPDTSIGERQQIARMNPGTRQSLRNPIASLKYRYFLDGEETPGIFGWIEDKKFLKKTSLRPFTRMEILGL